MPPSVAAAVKREIDTRANGKPKEKKSFVIFRLITHATYVVPRLKIQRAPGKGKTFKTYNSVFGMTNCLFSALQLVVTSSLFKGTFY